MQQIKYRSLNLSPSRGVENFELNPFYYNETFENGNRKHCMSELAELMLCSLSVFVSVFSECSSEVRLAFADSDELRDVNLAITLRKLGKL